MMKFLLGDLLRGPELIARFEQSIELSRAASLIGVHNVEHLRRIVQDLEDIASQNGFDAALAGAKRLGALIDKMESEAAEEGPSEDIDLLAPDTQPIPEHEAAHLNELFAGPIVKEIADALKYLRQTFDDQSHARSGVLLSQEEARLVSQESQPLFGDDVLARFPVAADDIAEAGACLAFGRGTATVFHLMRTMEAGLKGLGNDLSIPYAPSWESYIRQLTKLLDSANYDNLTEEQKQKRPVYREILGDLVAIKSAWRNPTMHIVRQYDTAQARLVFDAVRSLMETMAEKLSFDPVLTLPEPPPEPELQP